MEKNIDGGWRIGCSLRGATRLVIFVGGWVLKIPSIHSWKHFLWGLLGNMQERQFSKSDMEGLCPVIFSIPWGFLNVMPYARPFSDAEFLAFDFKSFTEREDYIIPVEHKTDSFGWLNGRPVAIDYGS